MSALHPEGPGDFFLDGSPHVQPRQVLESLARRHGVAFDDLRLCPVMVASFFASTTEALVEACGAEPTVFARRRSEPGRVYRAGGMAIGTMPVGAPAAVAFLEEMAVAGVSTFIVIGAAGSLQRDVPIGSVVLPSEAIREEGTSYHYLPSGRPALASPGPLARLREAAAGVEVPAAEGTHWTTDALYREHVEKIEAFSRAGVLSVDMEVSALFAAAQALSLECAAVLAISDVLGEPDGWREDFHGDGFRRARGAAAQIALAAAEALSASPNAEAGSLQGRGVSR